NRSTEAGFKYLLFGAMTSAIMVYGFSLLYGAAGATNMYVVSETVGRLLMEPGQGPFVLLSLMLVLVGFAFKISVVPLHFWAPDVYEGAPTPVTGFLSTASKAAGFAVLMRVMLIVFPDLALQWGAILAAIAVATMTLGNLLALAQKNLKRMLAYSSIAHAGYALIGIVALSELGIASVVFYLIVYAVTNLAAFGAVAAFSRVSGSDDIMSFAGLSRRSPVLALAMMVSFLSLAGMPPLGGFVIKFFVFAAAIQSQLIWLAVVGVLNAIIGLYYYLTVLKVVYLYRSDQEDQPIILSRPYAIGLTILTAGIILLGTIFGPWFNWAAQAARAMF
ncbi:MAG TPA: NADH-quinone oxidoreductase subunit N, partial [Anaerolineales bacterium]|nr:NADH-quinone oxidoreductase subunit N [Anaerolineales bacterium]